MSFFEQKYLNPFTADEQVPRVVEDDELTCVGQGSNEALPFYAFDAFAKSIISNKKMRAWKSAHSRSGAPIRHIFSRSKIIRQTIPTITEMDSMVLYNN